MWADQQKKKKANLRAAAADEEMAGVTFSPELNERSKQLLERRNRRQKRQQKSHPHADPVESALLVMEEARADRVEELRAQRYLEECTGTPVITEKAKKLPRTGDVAERLYSLHQTKLEIRDEIEANARMTARDLCTPTVTASPYNRPRSRDVPIEDDMLAREALRRRETERRIAELDFEREQARKPFINPKSVELARNRPVRSPRKVEDPTTSLTFTPVINARSKELDRGKGMSLDDRVEYLHKSREISQLDVEHVPTAREIEDEVEATFTPTITPAPGPATTSGVDVVERLMSWNTEREIRRLEAQEMVMVDEPEYPHSPAIIGDAPTPDPTNWVAGVDRFIERQQRARVEKARVAGSPGPNTGWRPRVTVPKEFRFNQRPAEPIASLQKPTVRRGKRQGRTTPSKATPTPTRLDSEVDPTPASPDQTPTLPEALSPTVLTDYSVILGSMAMGGKVTPEYMERRREKETVVAGIRECQVVRPWKAD